MSTTTTTVPETANVHYDVLLDNLVVVFGEADKVDLEELDEDLWVEFDASTVGRCVRVSASALALGRSGAWLQDLTEVVGPSVFDAWERERRRTGNVEDLSVDIAADRDALAWAWATLHRSALGERARLPAVVRLEATRTERLAESLRAWWRRGLGFRMAAPVPLGLAARDRSGASAAPAVLNLSLAEELAAVLGVSPTCVVEVGEDGIEVRLAVITDSELQGAVGVEAVHPPSPARPFERTPSGDLSARLAVFPPAGAELVLRFEQWRGTGDGTRA